MNILQQLLKPGSLVLSNVSRSLVSAARPALRLCCRSTKDFSCNFQYSDCRKMSQKSITSFFKITPKKTDAQEEKKAEADSPSPSKNAEEDKSPVTNGKIEKRSSKRQRLDSSEGDAAPLVKAKKSSPVTSEKKKKTKRLRIESSESEPETPPIEDKKLDIKVESKRKTYESPRSKKSKVQLETSPLAENVVKKKKTDKTPSPKKEAKKTQSKKSKKVEKSPLVQNGAKSPEATAVKEEVDNGKKRPEEKKVNKEVVDSSKKANAMSFFIKKDGDKKNEGINGDAAKVKVEDYNPSKPKYHPVDEACWARGEAVPYLALATTLEAIEGTSARLKIVEILSNYLRSVIALTPEDLLPSVYMCLNQLAPAYHSLELGIAETYLMKAIGQCTGRTLAQVKSAAQKEGDLGRVAQQARAAQRVMCQPKPLTARQVFNACKEIANMTGQASVNKKINKIQQLYTACRLSEAKFLIRSLEGKLRIGLAEQSVLQALALASTMTPPRPGSAGEVETLDASKGLSPEQFKARVDENALTIKTTYCECPNYDMLIPALLQYGVKALPAHCRLTPGIPLKPMLAHPTKNISEVFNRFEGQQFTCEWKYDGERAQLHVPRRAGADAPDCGRAAVFSRNQENNTTKYPDVVRRLPTLLRDTVSSCVLDSEAVAYDIENKQILPFQILSTRKRKDANESDIKVQVCVFVFDLLYLNGRALVKEPLLERRRLLHEHFTEVPGSWQFATAKDCSTMEEVQQFLDDSIKGSCEGLMVKMLTGDNARYDIARRSHNWLKLKKDYLEGVGDSIDAVVIGGWWGKGKRAGLLGGFLLACRDADADEFQALCKIGTGFSDEDLKSLTETLKEHVIDSPKSYYRYDPSHCPDVWFAAAQVWEVRCADLSLSPAHRAAIGLVDQEKGISLRFPRFVRVRSDKTPEQATEARQVADMYLAQDQVRNQAGAGGKTQAADDFY